MTKTFKDIIVVQSNGLELKTTPILVNGASSSITNVFMRQIQFSSAYKPGDDIFYDISIPDAETGTGNWFSTATMNGVNSTTGDYSTQFVANCSIIHDDTIRVWLHCLFGSNSNPSTKLCFTVMAWKGL